MVFCVMFIQVKLLNGFSEPLWYKVPADWQEKPELGSVVTVPLKQRKLPALVHKLSVEKPAVKFAIRPADRIEVFPRDKVYQEYLHKLAVYYQVDQIHFVKRIQQFVKQKKVDQIVETENELTTKKLVTLTSEQQRVVDFLAPHIKKPSYKPTVLHGVTGSGKTEVYKKLIAAAVEQGKTVLLLLPEVTLAAQFARLLTDQLDGSIPVTSFHSGTGAKEKRFVWQQLCAGKPLLIVGVHVPVLLPIAHLGLIIVDEEHEVGFQEKRHPKVNSKEAALIRAQLAGIPILLGSATPSITTLHNAKTKGWDFFQLKKRFAGEFPKVSVVQIDGKKRRKNFWITEELEKALAQRLENNEQSILFINRRGFSFFMQCKPCGFVFSCTNCSVSLTLHQNGQLVCHYCGQSQGVPKVCPSCSVKNSEFIKKGIGTQQVASIVQKLFPSATVARADLDTTVNRKRWQQTMQNVIDGHIDIIIGTQTITKGYHLPKVTLVGVLWADLNLNFPMFNAAETTLQQLIQVAGRAGRQRTGAEVVIQTMTQHPIFEYVHEVDYLKFYARESISRKLVGYPPFIRLAEIELKSDDEELIDKEAFKLVTELKQLNQKNTVSILGPALPPVHKVQNAYRRKIYLKAQNINQLIALFTALKKERYKSGLFFTPNPVT